MRRKAAEFVRCKSSGVAGEGWGNTGTDGNAGCSEAKILISKYSFYTGKGVVYILRHLSECMSRKVTSSSYSLVAGALPPTDD